MTVKIFRDDFRGADAWESFINFCKDGPVPYMLDNNENPTEIVFLDQRRASEAMEGWTMARSAWMGGRWAKGLHDDV